MIKEKESIELKFTKTLEENEELREEVVKKEKDLQMYLKKHFINSAIQTNIKSDEIECQENKVKSLEDEKNLLTAEIKKLISVIGEKEEMARKITHQEQTI